MTLSIRTLMTIFALACALPACSEAGAPDPSASEDDMTASLRLRASPAPAELVQAVEAAANDSGVGLTVQAFRFDPARGKDPSTVIAALRRKLAHAKLRVDEGEVGAADLRATLDEYQVTDSEQQQAIASALDAAVGPKAATRKLWLRSDDVAGADSEWAEVVLLYVSLETGTAIRLTVRYEA